MRSQLIQKHVSLYFLLLRHSSLRFMGRNLFGAVMMSGSWNERFILIACFLVCRLYARDEFLR